MKEGKMLLSKDDWNLTLKELKGQRVQLALNLFVVEAGIMRLEKVLKDGKG